MTLIVVFWAAFMGADGIKYGAKIASIQRPLVALW
jgi:hypothetical protein